MNLKDDYVSVRIADLLKENGFDECCGTLYINGHFNYGTPIKNSHLANRVVSAPTISLAMKWLRERYNVYISIIRMKGFYCVDICDSDGTSYCDIDNPQHFDSYYEAAENTLFNVLADLHIWVKQGYTSKVDQDESYTDDECYAKHLEECYDNNPVAFLAAMEMAAHIRKESSYNIEQEIEVTE